MLLRILETDDNNIAFTLYDRGDLVKATRGFHKANIVGEGAHGTVYKATLGTDTVVVKRCKQIEKSRTDEFVQELVVLCRVNHPNIVRLLGCCLHFVVPMLVYEFVPNGTLSDLLHGRPRRRVVTLPTRLRIAAETAEALKHLHSPPHPTLHGDVKPQNILLGDGWVAKVSDFGCSTINDNVQMYLQYYINEKGDKVYTTKKESPLGVPTQPAHPVFQITEKTDVYSFGVVLIELLTGKNPQAKEWKNLTTTFQDRMGNGTLGDLLDADIVDEGSMGLIYAAAKLILIDESLDGISVAFFVALLIAILLNQVFLNKEKKRQRYFEQHGGRMLSRILETEGNKTFKLYERGDLVKATHGFHKAYIVGEGAHGTVYKATLGTDTVAVKRCKQIEKSRTDEFVQELVVLCRVNHPRCFEAPMLLPRRRVTLPTRLRIAAETAEALAHLHSEPHRTLHGDVKPQNILLGDKWVAKVSDFGCSTINDNVQVVPKGTLAYLDPEFLQDFQITEKTDIYSFGVVLIELLTGKNPQAKEWKNLTTTFEDRMGNGTLGELLDADIVEEGRMELIYAAAKLVTRCIAAPGNARPAMGQVAVELRRFSYEMPESAEARAALEVEDGRYSCTATEGETTGLSNVTALSTELAR
ncbi:unnamed protein product [Miscanthus lutarioriparius]|uniref:Protein kinase domain-containing protein n=1 Tax=Miscanthus lutarioriparius TaxID=422564 RepID=A0A811QKJ9_9POAL|nr:unnamed protein product [Miscanthus lutarioriparius]